jgi:hypothetical protein
MDAIKEQVSNVVESWGRTMEMATANPSGWQPYLPNSSLAQVDEAVQTVSYWLNRVRAPSGFAPGFHVARAVAAANLPSLTSAAQQLESGQYNHFPSFLAGILTLLNALHTMVVFSQKEEGAATIGDLSAQLSQALALVNTAQGELATKVERLTEATAVADKVDAVYEDVEQKQGQCAKALEEAQESTAATAAALTEARASAEDVAKLSEKLSTLVSDGDKTRERLDALTTEAEGLKKKCADQQQLIDSLLPKGASAGLAAAFAARGGMLERTKWIWMAAFVVSLVVLAGFAVHLSTLKPPGNEYWSFVLYRMTLAAPFIWLAWFSAIQYGNTVRVQEDYAFKEATSKAFQGYRDHMEHLASIDDEEAGSAMSLMAQRTIEILAREPLRIFGRTHHDASPASAAASILDRAKKGSKTAED